MQEPRSLGHRVLMLVLHWQLHRGSAGVIEKWGQSQAWLWDMAGHASTVCHRCLQGTWHPEANEQGLRMAQPGPCVQRVQGGLVQAVPQAAHSLVLAVPEDFIEVPRVEQKLDRAPLV